MSSDGGSFGSAGLYVGTDWQGGGGPHPGRPPILSAHADSPPILSIDAGHAAMSVSITPMKRMGDEAVAFARELAQQAALFAADCERLHAEQHGRAHDDGQQTAD